MRVLHIANWYPSQEQPKRALWIKDQIELLSGVVDYDVWHVEVIEGRAGLLEQKEGKNENRLILSFPTKRWFLIEILSSLLLCYLFLVRVRIRDYTHLHFHIAYPLLTYWHFLRRIIDRPVVVSEHWSAYHYDFNIQDKKKLRTIRRIFYNPFHLITVSDALAQDIIRFSGNSALPYSVISNVVDPEVFAFQSLSIRKNTFFMVSQWKDPKDPFTVLKAITNMPAIKLRIGGYGPQMNAIQKLIDDLRLSDRVIMLGPLSKAEIAQEMNQAEAFVHSSNYETFSVVCAEAICCGCPVIASRVGGIPEFVRDVNGVLVDQQTTEKWEQSLVKFAELKFDRQNLQRSIQSIFDTDLKREILLNCYRKSEIIGKERKTKVS